MTQVAGPTLTDRLTAAFRVLIRAEDPNRDYRGVWEYIVQATDGVTCDLAPTDTTIPHPPLPKIVMRVGIPGCVSKPSKGSLAYVTFANGDPSKPYVVGYDGTKAQQININGTSPAAARTNDAVNAGYVVVAASGAAGGPYFVAVGTPIVYPGNAGGASAALAAANALTPPGIVVGFTSGQITGGSSTVNIG